MRFVVITDTHVRSDQADPGDFSASVESAGRNQYAVQLIEPSWVPTSLVSTPTLNDDLRWKKAPDPGREMREAHGIDRDAIFRDFFVKLEGASR